MGREVGMEGDKWVGREPVMQGTNHNRAEVSENLIFHKALSLPTM